MNRLNMIKTVITLTMVSIMLTGTAVASDWQQFQNDQYSSGQTLDAAPTTDMVLGWQQLVGSTGWAGIEVAPIVAESMVVVLDANGRIWAFDTTTGTTIWDTLVCGSGFQLSTPAYGDGLVFAASNDGWVYALNAADGSINWQKAIAGASDQLNTPVKYADGRVYVGEWSGGKIYHCLDASDGSTIWARASTSGGGYYWAGACAIGEYVIYGDDNSILTCVNGTGSLIDEENLKNIESGAGNIRSSVSYNPDTGRIYLTDKGGFCWAYDFDTTTGDMSYAWDTSIGYSTSTPAVYDGKVYVGQSSKLYCLNEPDGVELWNYVPNGQVQSSPALSIQGGDTYIYFTTNCAAGKGYCLDDDGNNIWEFASGTYTLQGMAVSDGWVYFGNDHGELFALTSSEPAPTAETPFLVSGNITYDNGDPVTNPVVTVTNPAIPEDFTVKTDAGSNLYLTLTNSGHASSGNTMRINASDGVIFNEVDYLVTAADINNGGFVLDILLVSGGMPDLNVTDKYEEWVNTPEKTYNVTYTVENIGSADADASNTSIRIDGVEVATDHVPELLIDASYTGTLGPFMLSGNNDTIEICADGDGVITELDETNNCLANVFEASGMPDLIVWVTLKTEGYVNEGNTLGVTVKNIGSGDAGSFNVSLAIDGTPTPEQSVSSLGAGSSTELEVPWTPTTTGGHPLSATADVNNDVSESDEANNDFARTSVIIKRTDWTQFHYDVVHTGFSPSGAPDTNETLWISDNIGTVDGASTVVADGKVFIYGDSGSKLYCFDEFTGAELWNIIIPAPMWGSWASPAYHDGKVVTSTGAETGCYNASNGDLIWAFENPTGESSCNGGPVIADGKVIVNDWQAGHFYCLDETTGELVWTFTEEQVGSWDVGYAQGVPAYEDGKFYLTTWLYVGGNLYCVDADTGIEIWNQTFSLDTCGSPTVVNDIIYLTTYDFFGMADLYAVSASDGSVLWQQPIQRSDSTPAVADGYVYVAGGCDGFSEVQTYCFDAIDGTPRWSTPASYGIGGWTCSVAVADGKVFVGEPSGYFGYSGTHALDATTGNVTWSYPEGGSSPAVADNIVFSAGSGRLYAFRDPLPDLTINAIGTPTNLRNDVINPISATVENIGGTNAENFVVSLDVDGTQVDTATIATLAAGENATVEFLWMPDATGSATLTVTADAEDSVEELDETNNDLAEPVDVLDKLTVTANVRIEGMNETVWTGDVTFSSSVLTATDGSIHYLNEPTALGALDEADKLGGFGYVLAEYSWGLYVEEIAGEPAIGWDGWMYRVNYVSPWVGAPDYTLIDSDEVLWYFGAWSAPPLVIELSATGVSPGEEFVATVTAYNGTSTAFEPVDNATVYADGFTFQTGTDGNATLSIDIAGDYMVYADKGTWADYTRSEKKVVTVLSVESYGESVYAKTNTRLAWRALGEPNDKGAVLSRNAMIAIELEETIPSCKDISVRVVRLGSRTVNFDVAVSQDGTNWDTIGSGTCGSWMTWVDCDFDGDFGDVRYIKITKPGTWWKPRLMGLDAVYAKN